MNTHRNPAPKQTALDAFMFQHGQIEAMLKRLTALADDHFNVDPDKVNWGHVGDLAGYAEQLQRVTDAAFREGECAPEAR